MNRRRFFALVLTTVMAAACGPQSPAMPTPVPSPPIEVRAGRFAPYVPVPVDVSPNAPPYIPDLSAIANQEMLGWLNPAQQAALEKAGFVVGPGGYEQIYTIYQSAEEGSRPVFVTTDALLHAFHILYDYALRLAEIEHFVDTLETLNTAMLNQAEADAKAASGLVQEAAQQNLAFFAVATRLLTPEVQIPAAVQDIVEKELTLIDGHSGFSESPIFGYKEDYSQYVPRGHYTRNETFERYFRAMMWYGRMSFHLANPQNPAAARRETRGALLIVRALYNTKAGDEPALDVWERIYEPTAFFVGTADDLTVYDYARVAQEVYGGLPDPATLADESRLDAFIDAAQKLRAPAIVGGLVTDQEDPEVVTQGFRLMGQRFIPDSYMFQQLVYDKVELYRGSGTPFTMCPSQVGPIRGFPRGLDIAAVLGSERALGILTVEGDTDYEGYAEQLAKLQKEFAALAEEQWTINLYWNWLHTLRPLLEVKGEEGYPYFMRTPTWADKDVHTWLGSWTELRHDTILYAKQSHSVTTTSLPHPLEPQRGYVEPQPKVYARLAALTRQMQAGLGERDLLGGEMSEKLEGMEELLLALKTISEKELRGEGLTEEEYSLIRHIGDTLENLTSFSEEIEGEIASAADERIALVADVHTNPETGEVLEEAIGNALPIYVVVLIEGQQVLTVGGVFSYYEFKWPMGDRLTDEAWQELSPRPDQPAWTGSFIVE